MNHVLKQAINWQPQALGRLIDIPHPVILTSRWLSKDDCNIMYRPSQEEEDGTVVPLLYFYQTTSLARHLNIYGYQMCLLDATYHDEQLFAECPVCLDVVLPPIWQCAQGQCLGCLQRLTTCPLCRVPIGDARNLELERIAGLRVHNWQYGCSRPMTLEEKVAHEAVYAWK
ncbi:SIAH1 [Branchiostoma lanceolatum]|uniref:SIAH1 protein n=1 Tax=Branchiostoma lanceolatum TaxID=7740 RepID=A0A8J9YSE6_BRALA|nr:SIAH1 [Branchiostoma lanceolatum]